MISSANHYSLINEKQIVSEVDSFTEKRYYQFSKFIKPPQTSFSILDIGCNTGRGGSVLRKMFPQANIIGIDVVENRLKVVPKGLYDSLLFESITNISLPSSSLDFILAGEVIEHIAPEDLPVVLLELKRVLKENGKLIMTTPNPDSFLVKAGRDQVYDDPSHLSIMPIGMHKSLLQQHGFKAVKIFGSGKAIRIFPHWFPIMGVFGSYLSVSSKE